MTTAVQRRRGTNTEHASFTGLEGELSVNTTNESVHVHDGSTAGGFELARADGSNIVATSIDINGGTIDGTTIGASSASTGAFTTLTATGLDVTGTVTADGVKTDHADGFYIDNAGATEASWTHTAATGASVINVGRNSSWGGDLTIKTDTKSRALFNSNGSISFYEDTGTTAKLFWDASAESLNIGSSSPAFSGNLTVTESATTGTDHFLQRWITGSGGVFSVACSDLSQANPTWQIRSGTSEPIAFNQASNERMLIDSSGQVGIGTSSPEKALHINSGTSNIGVRVESSDATASIEFMDSGTTGTLQSARVGGISDDFFVQTYGSERLRIDSSGNVGIGTTSPSQMLELSANNGSGVANVLRFNDADTGVTAGQTTGRIEFAENDGGNTTVSAFLEVDTVGTSGGGVMKFGTGIAGATATEAMRIDSSGNLLVGVTTNSSSVAGVTAGNSGLITACRSSNYSGIFNRLSTDGDIVQFRKDGSVVGSIGNTTTSLFIGSGDVGLRFDGANNRIRPVGNASDLGSARDNAIDLGDSSARFDDIYATNGTIQTSDRNEKQDIAELSEAEQRVAVAAKGLLRKFRWKDSVAEKGDDARIHFGIIAQDLQAAFEAEGLDAGDYAMFISTTWTDEETNEEKTRMGVRYSELLAFIISAI